MDDIIITDKNGNFIYTGAADQEITLPAGTYRMYVGYSADVIREELYLREAEDND